MQRINHDINDDVYELFEILYERLGDPKYKILEAAIEVFAALPKEAQYILKAQDENDRKAVLDHIRGLNLKSAKDQHA